MALKHDVDIGKVQERFAEMLPEITRRAHYAFRWLNPEAREEAVAETLALCWKNCLSCAEKGKRPGASSLVYYATLQVRAGRGLCGQNSTDVISRRTRMLGRATVESLNDVRSENAENGWWDRSEALEDRRTYRRPFHRVRIRNDYGRFLAQPTVSEQERRVFDLLAEGGRTSEIAERTNVSPARICQVKNSIGRKLATFMGPEIEPGYRARRG